MRRQELVRSAFEHCGAAVVEQAMLEVEEWETRMARLEKTLRLIADPTAAGGYDDVVIIDIYRTWAKNALKR